MKKELSLQCETRCDFFIDEKRKKIWNVELDLMKELLRVCKKYGIRVTAYAGTMLGAVRHNGFIPWDDDMDVAILREDYEKLRKVAKSEFQQPYFFQDAFSDTKYFIGYARLRNSETTGLISYNNSIDYNNGIYIDIFVLDGYVEDKRKLLKQHKEREKIEKILSVYYADINTKKGIKRLVAKAIQKMIRFIPYEKYVNKYNNIVMRYSNEGKVSIITDSINYIETCWLYVSDFDNIEYREFENILMPVCKQAHEILSREYGVNYMEFPPVEERGMWHYNVLTLDPDISYKEYIKMNI